MPRGRGNPLIKGLASGIGLVDEYRHDRAARKAKDPSPQPTIEQTTQNQYQPPNDSPPTYEHINDPPINVTSDPSPSDPPKKTHDPIQLIKNFITTHPLDPDIQPLSLPLPIVIPQRRPKDRSRGFFRAYPPSLSPLISQTTFLDLIEVLNTATLASPWLQAINLASVAFATLPAAVAHAASFAIAKSVGVGMTMQSRYRQNNVLELLNTEFFQPRGLYALVVTYRPGYRTTVDMNVNQHPAQPTDGNEHSTPSLSQRFASSNSTGNAEFETAELIFPEHDVPEEEGFKNSMKNFKNFSGEYFDRRGQAEFRNENPESSLNINSRAEYESRYADPNDVTNYDLKALMTGGKMTGFGTKRGGHADGEEHGSGGRGRGGRGDHSGRGRGRGYGGDGQQHDMWERPVTGAVGYARSTVRGGVKMAFEKVSYDTCRGGD